MKFYHDSKDRVLNQLGEVDAETVLAVCILLLFLLLSVGMIQPSLLAQQIREHQNSATPSDVNTTKSLEIIF